MATMWRKAMLYLGLGPDDEYDDYDAADDRPAPVAPRRAPGPYGRRRRPGRSARPVGSSNRPLRSRAPPPCGPRPPATGDGPAERTCTAVVRPLQPGAAPHVVAPHLVQPGPGGRRQFKANQPVAMDLLEVDRELSRRLIDFSSGLCYGLGGKMEKVANQVYLLTPNVEVRRRTCGASTSAATTRRLIDLPWTPICLILNLYWFVILARMILSPGSAVTAGTAGGQRLLGACTALTEPVLGPLRRVIPPVRMGTGRHRRVADHRPRRGHPHLLTAALRSPISAYERWVLSTAWT